MIAVGENELICDFAETYHIYDYKALPLKYRAVLSAGLRDDSRINKKIAGMRFSLTEILLAHIADNIFLLRYGLSEEAFHNKNTPPLFTEDLKMIVDDAEKTKNVKTFSSGEDFEKWWGKHVRGEKNG